MFEKNTKKEIEFFAFPPIEEEKIDLFRSSVAEIFKINLTDEYINVLRVSNGFMIDNLTLYGSKPLERNTYSVPNIFSANEKFTKSDIQGKLILCSFLNTYLIMDWTKPEKYFLIDGFSLNTLEEFSSFAEALEYFKKIIKS